MSWGRAPGAVLVCAVARLPAGTKMAPLRPKLGRHRQSHRISPVGNPVPQTVKETSKSLTSTPATID
jgi:hypothetical protein